MLTIEIKTARYYYSGPRIPYSHGCLTYTLSDIAFVGWSGSMAEARERALRLDKQLFVRHFRHYWTPSNDCRYFMLYHYRHSLGRVVYTGYLWDAGDQRIIPGRTGLTAGEIMD